MGALVTCKTSRTTKHGNNALKNKLISHIYSEIFNKSNFCPTTQVICCGNYNKHVHSEKEGEYAQTNHLLIYQKKQELVPDARAFHCDTMVGQPIHRHHNFFAYYFTSLKRVDQQRPTYKTFWAIAFHPTWPPAIPPWHSHNMPSHSWSIIQCHKTWSSPILYSCLVISW